MVGIIKKTERTVFAPGRFEATVREIEDATGKYGPQLAWRFDLGDGLELRAWTSAKMSETSKLGLWVQALLGEVPDELDPTSLVGRPCIVNVSIQRGPQGDYNRVDSLGASRRKPKPTPIPVDDEDVEPIAIGERERY